MSSFLLLSQLCLAAVDQARVEQSGEARKVFVETLLGEVKRDLSSNSAIARAIQRQCQNWLSSLCDLQSAFALVVENTRYAPGNPLNGPDVMADTCPYVGGCPDLNYGEIRVNSHLLHYAPEWKIKRVLMHELLHNVYVQLGFPDTAGPQTTPEGEVVSAVKGRGEVHHRLIYEIVSHSQQIGVYRP